ncbi:histidine kinase [Streptomyces sp. NPDC006393]|uniref:sensor histidine kinase n=1 Tax=Streptomyces sp. NPDC006393 TaxID=3156763 RepID=UPI0033E18292
MRKKIRPLVSRATYRGWSFAFLGAAASVPPLLVAAFSTPSGEPGALRGTIFVLVFAVVVAAMAWPRATRRASVRLADQLLGVRLPAPVEPHASRWVDWLRTSAWLVVHMVMGGAVTAVTGLGLFAAVMFPAVWLGAGGGLTVFWFTVRAPHGWQGAWTLLPAAGCLLIAACVSAALAAGLRRLAPLLLGHGRAERLAAAEERMNLLAQRNRLAQELHDSIGHTLTASTIQAAVARELLERDPQAALRALGSIEETSRAAMDDLDHVLGVLRQEQPSTRPQPTLAGLGPLTERMRRTGADLAVDTTGDLARVPATVSREAYRIVQEGLTNALRHGGKTGIRLRVAAYDGWLEVQITNPVDVGAAVPRSPRRQGHGLAGIGERVRLLRGEVSAGLMDDGLRWHITARIPLPSGS